MKLFRPKCLTTTLAILFCFFTFNCYAQPVVPLPSSGTLYLVGDATQGGWANPVPVPSQQFAQLDSVTYGGVFNLIGGKSYLILPANGSWETKYAIPDTNAVGVTTSGSFKYYTSGGGFNFIAPSLAGTYTIKLDFEKGTYSLNPFVGTFPDSLYIVGDATAGGWNNPVPVPSQQFTQENSGIFELTLPLKADASYLFLPVNGDWSHKLGGASPTGGTLYTDNAMPSSNTPSPLVAGTYKIVVNFVTSQYSVTSVDSTTYSFSPDTAYAGTTVTIKGSGFTGATAVSFGGIAADSFFVVSDSTIKAVVDSNGYTGNISITTLKGVVNLAGFLFLVKGGITPPTTGTLFIVGTSVSGGWANPVTDSVSQKFIKVTPFDYKLITPLIGGGQYKFIAESGSWGENWGAKGYYDSSEIYGGVIVSIGQNILGPAQSGTYLIDVNFATSMFTVTPVAPNIVSISNSTANKGDTIIIKGACFTGTTRVSFGGDTAASFTILNDSTIKAVLSIGASGNVVVTTGSGTDSLGGFSYCKPSQDTISITACGSYTWHKVTYTKSGYYNFDTLSAGGCDSLTTLVLKINKPTADTIIKSALNNYTWHGTNYTKSGVYTFDSLNTAGCDSLTVFVLSIYYPPVIVSFSPTNASVGQSVTIKGSGFAGATAVSFGDSAAASYKVVDDRTIIAVVGGGAYGSVYVTNNGIKDSLAGFGYCNGVIPSVTIGTLTGSNPNSTSIVSNTSVTLSATPLNGGRIPSYQWFKNGVSITGATSSTYTSSKLLNNDSIWVFMNSNAACRLSDTAVSNKVYMYVSNAIITNFAGTGTASWSGDGGSAKQATLNNPYSVAVDTLGNVYIVEGGNNDIRKVAANGIISTIIGTGTATYSGDGGKATDASINAPTSVTIDKFGNIYIADYGNNRVRKVDTKGIITTIAGNGIASYSGDGGLATAASLNGPKGVAVDTAGNLYIAEYVTSVIRMIDKSGIITTVAGNGKMGYSGDGGLATFAQLFYPNCVTVDNSGNLYIADSRWGYIRKVDKKGIISKVAGIGTGIGTGDGGLATSAGIYGATGIAVDGSGNLYVTDWFSSLIRIIEPNGSINSVAGNGFGADNSPAVNASLNHPTNVVVDKLGNLYICDAGSNRLRKVKLVNGTLPVSLDFFTASVHSSNVAVNWLTATELNTSHFIVQHSANGSTFTDLGSVKAIGIGANKYEYTDFSPVSGTNYYRLKSVDKDGTVTYSKVVSVQLTIDNYQLSIIPNPAKDIVTVKGNHIASVQVIDNLGRVVKVVSLKDATNPVLSVGGLASGVYHMRVQTTDGKVSGANLVVSY